MNAIYDVDFDATVKVSVVALQPGDDAATVTATLSLLSADTDHQRGTFPGAEREVEAEAPLPAVGVTHLSFDGNTVDADLAGIDATTGKATSLVGNYGVVYKFLGTASGKSAFVMAPRGGGWGGAGNVSAGDDADAGLVQLPATTGSTPADGSAIVLGRFASGATVSASFLSAGGSSLPVSLVNVPLP